MLIALGLAWYTALHAPSFGAGLVDVVMCGDTDTNACIAGALLGCRPRACSRPAVTMRAQVSSRFQTSTW